MSDDLLAFSTSDEVAETFTVNDTEYVVYSTDAVSRKGEAEMLLSWERLGRAAEVQGKAKGDNAIRKANDELRAARAAVLAQFTSLPEDVITELGMRSQLALLQAIGKHMTVETAPNGATDE